MQREEIEEADCSVCNKPLGQDELDDLNEARSKCETEEDDVNLTTNVMCGACREEDAQ